MNMNLLKNKYSLAALLLLVGITACVKKDFDEPPTGGEPVNVTANTTIKDLKAFHKTPGGFDTIPGDDNKIIQGVVVMDDRSGNYYKTLVIQDATGGIEIKFNDGYLFNQFPVGRTIYVQLKDLLLTDYNGLTQLTGSLVEESGQFTDVGLTELQVRQQVVKGPISDTPPQPRVISLSELSPDMVSTLIRIENVQFIKADTGKTYADAVTKYSLNRQLQDCGNNQTVILRTSGYADFANTITPAGNGTITGVLGIYGSTLQLYIRDLGDIQMSNPRCGPVLSEDFSSVSTNTDVSISGWLNIAVKGNRKWRGNVFQGDGFVQATAFNSSLAEMESWLISPAIDLSKPQSLSFNSSWGFYVHDGLTVWISTNFDGANVSAATWQPLNGKIAKQSDGQYTWIPSGNIALPVVNGGKGYIGFKYVGDTNTNTTTWRIDNIAVK